MPETVAELTTRLTTFTQPGARGRLLARGLARGLIWRDGVLPDGAPAFSPGLTEDLLDHGHAGLALALRLRATGQGDPALLERAFLVAGEAIEAAVHRGRKRDDSPFHRVTAAVSFHLGGYAARAYSMLPSRESMQNLSPNESALVDLLRRNLSSLQGAVAQWLLDPSNADEAVAGRLADDDGFDEDSAIHSVLTSSFMRGLALFDHGLSTGQAEFAMQARKRLVETAAAARDLNAVSHWWTATLATHLIDDLWKVSLHQQIPELPPHHPDSDRWHRLRRAYIERLRNRDRAAIELWPSQIIAARRAIDPADDLVVALPTSAGKTRIAELCILRTLAAQKRVIYITPLRSLSAQVERDLATTLQPLGVDVTSLYGSAGIQSGDEETFRAESVVVSTPEKLDFALRNDPTLIDDIGLVVLDEGHMLGADERKVRYEALIQRLLSRPDAGHRRIVCLSALFPAPQEMRDLVGWIRADAPGEPVHSTWRPTRRRYGVVRWGGRSARLDVAVEEERPYVSRFIEQVDPPTDSLRKRPFPSTKAELTLATAWRFLGQEKEVLIYCSERRSVEPMGRRILDCIRQGVLPSLGSHPFPLRDALAAGAEWLGEDHPAVACLEHGVALHHGGLPRPFLNEVERLLRLGACRLTIASPTLAQGLNLSASVLLVPSIRRNREVIPADELANVAGRAGRAFVDVEGLVLHVVWEGDARHSARAIRSWETLLEQAKAPRVASGILELVVRVCDGIAKRAGIAFDEVVEYVANHDQAWDRADGPRTDEQAERDLASIDSALLSLLETNDTEEVADGDMQRALAGSLFARELARTESAIRTTVNAFLLARARRIWRVTTPEQRTGFYRAGVGLASGSFIHARLDDLIRLLVQLESDLGSADAQGVATSAIAFAEQSTRIAPFRPAKELPARWREALVAWLAGEPGGEVMALCDGSGADVIHDLFAYRLPWAMEAVRVHGLAVGHADAEQLSGIAAQAVEAGTCDRRVIILLRAGLASREAAAAAVATTAAEFDDPAGMREWLGSTIVQSRSAAGDWPTLRSRSAWHRFFLSQRTRERGRWRLDTQIVRVQWNEGQRPARGTSVITEAQGRVMTPDFQFIGVLRDPLRLLPTAMARATVRADGGLAVESYSPDVDVGIRSR